MTVVGAIDCGTHSVRLLVAQAQDGPTGVRLKDLHRQMQIVGLGQGVDKTGHLAEEALERTFAALHTYREHCDAFRVDKLRMVATSASRDADNFAQFATGVEEILGIAPEVISGQEEASLSFRGATFSHAEAPRPALVVDIGGGSTELSLGDKAGHLTNSVSLNMGCTRVTERYLAPTWDSEERPSLKAIAAGAKFVDSQLDKAEIQMDLSGAASVIGVAGTVTTLTALSLGLEKYEPAKIDGARVELGQMLDLCHEMGTLSRDQRQQLGPLHPGRIRVIAGGALIWSRILLRLAERAHQQGRELTETWTSEHDILDGIALQLLGA